MNGNFAIGQPTRITCDLSVKEPALDSLGYHYVAREKYMKAQTEEVPD